MASTKPPGAKSGACPICGKPTEQRYRPFCSRRCADIDLSRWLSGAYAIPAEPDPEDDPEAASAGSPPINPDETKKH
jgi:endogenous inhibitor of DNA gyrase (YacG/DUF329 family)